MAGVIRLPSNRGELYYQYYQPHSRLPPSDSNPRFVRPRARRPASLCIASVGPEWDLEQYRTPTEPRSHILSRKLARSRESAKRFFRLSFNQNTTNPEPTPTTQTRPRRPRPVSEIIFGSLEPGAGEMMSDSGRPAPRRESPPVDGSRRGTVGGPLSGIVHRPQLAEDLRRASAASDIVIPFPSFSDEKPVANGSGISVSISLAEPVLYLQGFDANDSSSRNTTMLRGSLHLKVTKQAKLKSISLNFRGRTETDWPEGIPPRRTEFKDSETIINHTWPFFNAQFPMAEHSFMADHVQLAKAPGVTTKELGVTGSSFDLFQQRSVSPAARNATSREAKRLSLQTNQSRSFGKGDTPHGGPTVSQKGFKVFHPGDYVYNFELPIDSRLPESIDVDLGTVKYELEALVERSGAFRANLVGSKEVTFIRAPTEGSLEQVEPIAISRNWEDQLHYDIVISGKSFPIGAQVPIAFKLTPLAKVQCHRIKVFVTENIQYFTANKRVHRLEPTRKVLLFEKRAEGHSTSTYPGSTMRIVSGGGVAYDDRAAAARGVEDVRRDGTNLLGNLDHAGGSIGPTEMEFNVQLPSCHAMKDKPRAERITFDTTSQSVQVNHWIKIVMRLSKPDDNDPGKRRHFEISIDSPFHILSCRATQANIALPAYSSGGPIVQPADQYECGCPGATMRRRSTPPNGQGVANLAEVAAQNASTSSVNSISNSQLWNSSAGLTRPDAAHIAGDPNSGPPRPMHLLRAPSFNPPAFGEDDPPPPLITPPPDYGQVVQGDPREALADYFARLADEVGDDDDNELGRGRVDIPLTPGARINRSMDARRTWLPIGDPAR